MYTFDSLWNGSSYTSTMDLGKWSKREREIEMKHRERNAAKCSVDPPLFLVSVVWQPEPMQCDSCSQTRASPPHQKGVPSLPHVIMNTHGNKGTLCDLDSSGWHCDKPSRILSLCGSLFISLIFSFWRISRWLFYRVQIEHSKSKNLKLEILQNWNLSSSDIGMLKTLYTITF
jgi:hypothetical protein